MGTAVSHGEDCPVFVQHRDGLVQADHHAGLGFQFLECPDTDGLAICFIGF